MDHVEAEGKTRWDRYRADYAGMAYGQVSEDHRWVWENYPDQNHHSASQMDAFFEDVPDHAVVVEVGGWRGEAAERTLAKHPEIAWWINLEICQEAVEHSIPTDPRYEGIWPDQWVWELYPPYADVAVLAHVIEHVSDEQLPLLLGWVARTGARRLYIEAPIYDAGQGWWGGNTTHLLTSGWDVVITLLGDLGYDVKSRLRTVDDPALGHGHDAIIVEKR